MSQLHHSSSLLVQQVFVPFCVIYEFVACFKLFVDVVYSGGVRPPCKGVEHKEPGMGSAIWNEEPGMGTAEAGSATLKMRYDQPTGGKKPDSRGRQVAVEYLCANLAFTIISV